MVSLGKTCLARATADRERTSARSIIVWKFSLAHVSAAANLTGPCVMSIVISRTRAAHANTNGNSAVGAAVVVGTAAVIVTSKSLGHATAANRDTVTGETSHAHATAAIRACHCGEQDHRHQGNQPCTRSSEREDRRRHYTPPMSNHNLDVLDPTAPCRRTPQNFSCDHTKRSRDFGALRLARRDYDHDTTPRLCIDFEARQRHSEEGQTNHVPIKPANWWIRKLGE